MRSNTPPMTPRGANVPMARITRFRQGMLSDSCGRDFHRSTLWLALWLDGNDSCRPMWAGHVWCRQAPYPWCGLLGCALVSSVVWWRNRLTMRLFYLGMKIKPGCYHQLSLVNVRFIQSILSECFASQAVIRQNTVIVVIDAAANFY